MFGGSLFNDMSGDPFFAEHAQHMQRMNQMMMDPFGGMSPMMGMPALEAPSQQQQRDYQRRGDRRVRHPHQQLQQPGAMMPFMGGSIFDQMNQMMGNMDRMMGNMRTQMTQVQSDPNSQCYSHTSFMSYSSDGQGQPRVYQASTSTKQVPGGVRETQKTVRDSQRGIEKMSVGRQIGDRRHVITKQKDARTGDMEENHDYDNLDEDEAAAFHNEFMSRTRRHPSSSHNQLHGRRSRQSPAIGYRERD